MATFLALCAHRTTDRASRGLLPGTRSSTSSATIAVAKPQPLRLDSRNRVSGEPGAVQSGAPAASWTRRFRSWVRDAEQASGFGLDELRRLWSAGVTSAIRRLSTGEATPAYRGNLRRVNGVAVRAWGRKQRGGAARLEPGRSRAVRFTGEPSAKPPTRSL